MKASLSSVLIVLLSCASGYAEQGPAEKPDRTALARVAQSNPNSVSAWMAYAEFLDRYGDPGAREAYTKLLEAMRSSGDSSKTAAIEHRIKIYGLLAGDGAHGSIAQSWPT